MPSNPDHPGFHVSDHPLILDKLHNLRDAGTGCEQFRRLVHDLSTFLFYEATTRIAGRTTTVETPLEKTNSRILANRICLVPILRAGLGMVNGILPLVPQAAVGMIGLYRDEETLQPVDYYQNMPEDLSAGTVFLVDPMLATGGSAVAAADHIKKAGAPSITMLTLISAPEGVRAMQRAHPEIHIYSAALDRRLNDRGYILPGLGDAGDRYFGT